MVEFSLLGPSESEAGREGGRQAGRQRGWRICRCMSHALVRPTQLKLAAPSRPESSGLPAPSHPRTHAHRLPLLLPHSRASASPPPPSSLRAASARPSMKPAMRASSTPRHFPAPGMAAAAGTTAGGGLASAGGGGGAEGQPEAPVSVRCMWAACKPRVLCGDGRAASHACLHLLGATKRLGIYYLHPCICSPQTPVMATLAAVRGVAWEWEEKSSLIRRTATESSIPPHFVCGVWQ
jgi:hypothetical protein